MYTPAAEDMGNVTLRSNPKCQRKYVDAPAKQETIHRLATKLATLLDFETRPNNIPDKAGTNTAIKNIVTSVSFCKIPLKKSITPKGTTVHHI